MTHPNFFIVGAPKCGTTSLAAWLREHEQVYMPPLKEPEFFNVDHKRRRVLSWRRYRDLFDPATPDRHRAIGEASVWYLYSDVAIRKILDTYGDNVKFIVMLRNPINMAVSLHQHKLYVDFEHIENFEQAWRSQEDRRREANIVTDAEPSQLVYGDACMLGAQLRRLYALAGRERTLPILLSDVREDARGVYKTVLDFLELHDDGRTEFPHLNKAKTYKRAWLHKAVQRAARVKSKLGITHNFNILRNNQKPATKPELRPDFREELEEYFREDVQLLSALLDRDLTSWVPTQAQLSEMDESPVRRRAAMH